MDDTKYGIDKSWLDAGLDISLIDDVMHVISQKRQSRTILPAHNDVLNALKLTPFSDVKVLIIGQDPYPSAEHAHGLAFSSLSPKTPASLKNIFKKLENDFPNAEHKSNLLINWAKQGVLLLNTSLTFEGKDSKLLKEHTNLWAPVIQNVYEVLIKKDLLIVFRWGDHAKKSGQIFDNKKNVAVFDTTHPSPFSAHKGFMTSEHFTKCNELLKEKAIDWST